MKLGNDLNFYNLGDVVVGSVQPLHLPQANRWAERTISLDNLSLQNGEQINNENVIHLDGISYGPYILVPEGTYQIKVEGKNLKNSDMDVFSNEIGLVSINKEIIQDNQIIYQFTLATDVADIEFRFFNKTLEDVIIKNLTVQKIS